MYLDYPISQNSTLGTGRGILFGFTYYSIVGKQILVLPNLQPDRGLSSQTRLS